MTEKEGGAPPTYASATGMGTHADQGYPPPDQGYPQPEKGNPAPGPGYPTPGPGYPTPGPGYPTPGPGYPTPGQGYPPPGQGYPPPGQGYPNQQAYSPQYGYCTTTTITQPGIITQIQTPPPDHFCLAVFVTLCCFWPIGIVAIMKASEARSSVARGDMMAAHTQARSAKQMSLIGIGIGIVSIVIVGVIIGVTIL